MSLSQQAGPPFYFSLTSYENTPAKQQPTNRIYHNDSAHDSNNSRSSSPLHNTVPVTSFAAAKAYIATREFCSFRRTMSVVSAAGMDNERGVVLVEDTPRESGGPLESKQWTRPHMPLAEAEKRYKRLPTWGASSGPDHTCHWPRPKSDSYTCRRCRQREHPGARAG